MRKFELQHPMQSSYVPTVNSLQLVLLIFTSFGFLNNLSAKSYEDFNFKKIEIEFVRSTLDSYNFYETDLFVESNDATKESANIIVAGDCCDQVGKPIQMTFRFLGGGCAADNNSQGDKAGCNGGVIGDGPYTITEDDGSFISLSTLTIGDIFTVGASGSLPNPIMLRLNGGQEVIEIHTSCSAPIVPGDRFGSLELLSMLDDMGETCGNPCPNPIISFNDLQCIEEEASFSLSLPESDVIYTWDFGADATPSSYTGITPPAITYSTTGIKTITVTQDGTCQISININVGQCECPEPTIEYDPLCTELPGIFSTPDLGDGFSYMWNFGSGATPTTATGRGPHAVSFGLQTNATVKLDIEKDCEPDFPPFQGDCCDSVNGKPSKLTFTFVGGGCASDNNTQGDKSDCLGGVTGDGPFSIFEEGGSSVSPSSVSIGDEFFVSTSGSLPNPIVLRINGGQETIEIHTSCSAPLVLGQQFGSLLLTGLETDQGDICGQNAGGTAGGDCCDQIDGKPRTMTFRFDGGGCAADNNSQGDKSDCTGGVSGSGPFSISEDDGSFIDQTSVSIGDVFVVSSSGSLPNPIMLRINGGQEVIEIHTSCSAPLVMGERYGSLTLLSFTTDANDQCGPFEPPVPCFPCTASTEVVVEINPFFECPEDITLQCIGDIADIQMPTISCDIDTCSLTYKDDTLSVDCPIIIERTWTIVIPSPIDPEPPIPPIIPSGDCCANFSGDLASITFRYIGGSCADGNNNQEGKAICNGGSLTSESATISFSGGGNSYFSGTVNLNEDFTISNGGNKLDNNIEFSIAGGGAFQSGEIHGSCSKRLAVGDQFGAVMIASISSDRGEVCGNGNGGFGQGDCCDSVDGKPRSLTFRFDGGGCAADNNSQGSKANCTGGAIGSGPFSIFEDDGAFVSPSSVSIGDTFTVSSSGSLPNPIMIRINGGQEVIEIHTSCSAPIVLGDRFGSLTLIQMNTDQNQQCGPIPPPEPPVEEDPCERDDLLTFTCTQTITILDTISPTTIGDPDDLTLGCADDVPAEDTNLVQGFDNCSFTTIFEADTTGVYPCDFTITRTWKFTDECGNMVSEDQVIRVISDLVAAAAAANNDPNLCAEEITQLFGSATGGCGDYSYSWTGPSGFESSEQNPNGIDLPGIYELTVVDKNGCTDKAQIEIIVIPPPDPEAGPDQTICKGEAVIIGSDGVLPDVAYQWFIGENPIDGANASLLQVTPSETTSYIVKITTNDEGCMNRDTVVITVENCNSIGSTVWLDVNNNGMIDTDEEGIQGVVVTLLDADGMELDEDVTDEDGNYFFDNLMPMKYEVIIKADDVPQSYPLSSTGSNQSEDIDNNDNGDQPDGAGNTISSGQVMLTVGTEPVGIDELGTNLDNNVGGLQDDDLDEYGDMTVDFGLIPAIDLELIKTVSVDGYIEDCPSADVGDEVLFTITIINKGPNEATNIEVTDMVPNGFGSINASADDGSVNGSLITWNIPSLDVGVSEILTFTVIVLEPFEGVDYVNIAEITDVDQFDIDSTPGNGADTDGDRDTPNGGIGSVEDDTTQDAGDEDDGDDAKIKLGEIDLELFKTVSVDGSVEDCPSVSVGDEVLFTITVSNQGPDEATNIVVTDIVPSGYGSIGADAQGGMQNGSFVNWEIASLEAGESTILTFTAIVLAPFEGVDYVNIAEITAADQFDIDSTPGNGADTDGDRAEADGGIGSVEDDTTQDDGDEDDGDDAKVELEVIDLELIKTVSVDGSIEDCPSVSIGDQVTFTITISNQGPDVATNIEVTDMVPNGYTNIDADAQGGTQNASTVTWNFSSLEVGESALVTFTAIVLEPFEGVDYVNIAEITAADQFDIDSTPGNGADTDGDRAEANGGIGSVEDDTTQDDGDEDDGDDAKVEIETIDLELVKTVTVDGSTEDCPSVTPGDEVLFTVTISNNGPDNATNIEVTDLVPNGYGSINASASSGNVNGSTITWDIASLNASASTTLTFTAIVLEPFEGVDYVNIAEITAADQQDIDSTPGNGADTDGDRAEADGGIGSVEDDTTQDDGDEDDGDDAKVEIETIDLELVKTVTVDGSTEDCPSVTPGDEVLFTVTISNNGPDNATNIEVTDLVPNGYGSINASANSGNVNGSTITWDIASLNASASTTLTFTAIVLEPFEGVDYVNIAEITDADQFDSDSTPGNGADTDGDRAEADGGIGSVEDDTTQDDGDEDDGDDAKVEIETIDLELVKTVTVDGSTEDCPSVTPSDEVLFTVTISNNGPDNATNIEVTDLVPNGYGSINASANSGNVNGSTITWDIASLNASASTTLTFTAIVLEPFEGVDYVNIAEITDADQFDSDSTPGNGADTDGDRAEADGGIGSVEDDTTQDDGDEDDGDDAKVEIETIDLELVKTVTVDGSTEDCPSVTPSDEVLFTVTISNNGPDNATNIEVTDLVPNGYGSINASANSGNVNGSTITWDIASLNASASTTLTFTAIVLEPFEGVDYVNIAEITDADQFDSDSTPGNGADTDGDRAEADGGIGSVEDDTTQDDGDEDDGDDAKVLVNLLSIGSTVYVDVNNNGIQDDDEPGIIGITVEVYDLGLDGIKNNGGGDDNLIGSDLTDENGDYFIDGLLPGQVYVKINEPDPSYPVSSVGAGSDDQIDGDDNGIQMDGPGGMVMSEIIILSPGDEPTGDDESGQGGDQDDLNDANGDMTIDFGFFEPASIGDYVWEDLNDNGLQDDGEPGIPGVTVMLTDTLGNAVDDVEGNEVISQPTGGDGSYLFDNLFPGDYKVTFSAPDGFEPTQENVNNEADDDGANDSDPNEMGMSDNIWLDSGEDEEDIDAGYLRRGKVCIYTFKDCDSNGDLRGDEALGNVPFDYLYTDVNGAQINGDGQTDADGKVCITLKPGSIDIRILFPTSPTGLTFTLANQVDDAFDSDANANGEIPRIIVTSGSFTEVAAGFRDIEKPTLINVPSDILANCDEVIYPETPKATDNCDDYVDVQRDSTITYSELCPQNYVIEYVWTATDDCGNVKKAWTTLKVEDTEAPVAGNQPQHITVECGEPVPPFDPEWKDNCSEELELSAISSTSYDGCKEIQTMKYTAKDECGNEASVSRKITIVDTTDPELINVPSDATYECDAVVYPATPSATDNCDDDVTVTRDSTITLGDCPQNYTIEYVWTVTDDCGNEKKAWTTIKVEDTKAPVAMNQPADISVECGEPIPPYDPEWKDNCSEELELSAISSTSYDGCKEIQTMKYTAKDECGNEASVSRKITIVDTTDPELINVPSDANYECDAVVYPTTPSATDNCDKDVYVTRDSTITAGDCPQEYTIEYVWTATDDCGNEKKAWTTIKVQDTKGPVAMNPPTDEVINCGDNITPYDPMWKDNCSVNLEITVISSPGSTDCGEEQEYVYTATDECGNTSEVRRKVKIVDNEDPFFDGLIPDKRISCNEPIEFGTPAFADNCSVPTLTHKDDRKPGRCPNEYVVTRTWTITDLCGNTATTSANITVWDNDAPELLNVPRDASFECDKVIYPETPKAIDNCTGYIAVSRDSVIVYSEECPQNLTITYTWTASDECANTATDHTVIKIMDTTAPVIGDIPEDLLVLLAQGEQVPEIPEVDVTDNCDPTVQVKVDEKKVPADCGYILKRTWTAVDACGNEAASKTQEIKVIEGIEASVAPAIVELCEGYSVDFTASPNGDNYLYEWTVNGGGTLTNANSSTVTFTGDTGGTYTISVKVSSKDAQECYGEATATIKVRRLPRASISNNGPICTGGTLMLGATGGLTYEWSGPDGFSSMEQNPTIENANGDNAGTYTVVITEEECSTTLTTKVELYNNPVIIIENNSPVCEGETVVIKASGGTDFMWMDSDDNVVATGSTLIIENVQPSDVGIYTVMVSNNNKCAAEKETEVVITDKPEDIITKIEICQGDSYVWEADGKTYTEEGTYHFEGEGCIADQYLKITFKSSGGEDVVTNESICPGESYTWSVNEETYTDSGTYTVEGEGCYGDQILILTVTPKPEDIITKIEICQGDSYVWEADGKTYTEEGTYHFEGEGCIADQYLKITFKSSGGEDVVTNESICPGESYTWSVNEETYTDSGTYTVEGEGCYGDQILILTVTPKPEDIITKIEICQGDSYVWEADGNTYTEEGTYHFEGEGCIADQYLKITFKSSGGEDVVTNESICPGESYTWSVNEETYTEPGTYTVEGEGCYGDQILILTVTPKPEDIITKIEICQGDSYVWEADGNTYSEEGTYHFEGEGCIADQYLKITFKSSGGEDVVTNESICPGESFTWSVNEETYTESGEYTVEGEGCYGDQILILTVAPKPEDIITKIEICEGDIYVWEADGNTYSEEGTYHFEGEGCIADQYLKITFSAPVYAEVEYTSNSGCDDNDGAIKLTPASNTYVWGDGGNGAERTDLSVGDYVITATNDAGCAKIFEIAIGMDCECILPRIEKIETTDITCGNDGTATITTTTDPSKFIYTWLPNEGTPTDDIGNSRTGLPAGKYDVIVTYPGAKDCFAKATITIKEDGNAVSVTADVINGDCETSGSIVLNVSGGDGTYTYNWAHIDGSDNPKDISELESGNYAVVVSDGAGCSHELENIAVFRDCDPCDMLEDIRVETTDETCNEKGSARFTPNTYSFTWIHDNVQAEYRTGLNAGIYIVVAEDPQTGCKTELEVVIDLVEPKDATINVDEEILLTCENYNGATIDFTVDYEEGFALPWQIIIANENGQNIPNGSLVAGDYCLYVKDANRCTITKKCITLIAPEIVDASYEVIDAECGLGGAIDLTISSGTGPFVYTWSDGNTNEDRINVDAGSYDVTIVDGNLCETVIKEIVVTTNCDPCIDGTGPEVEVTKMDAGCDNDGYIKLTVLSDADNTYNWSDLEGADNPKDRDGLAPATYKVTVTDNKGCSTVKATTISTNCDGGPTDCDIFDQDELSVTTTECDGGAKICLGVKIQDFKDLHLQVNGQDYSNGITACNYAVTYSYQFKFLLDATPNGPYELEWSFDDVAFHKDSLNDISELAEFIIENDPSGNWTYNAEEAFLIGGNTDYDYSALRIFHYETAAKYELNINTIYVPSNVEVTLPVGEHEIVIIDSSEDCTDTVRVTVVCESAENIIRTITVGDQTMVCLSDIVKGDGTSFENTCPSDLDYVLASYNPVDDCITFSGNEVGSMQFCYENCDADGNCKTTTITINVTPVNHRMVFITMVPGEDSTYCFDVSDFELNGDIDQVYLGCEDDDNEAVDFKLNETNDCLEISAVALGEDDACLEVCDDTNTCDSLTIIVTVVDPTGGTGPLPNAVDNDTLTTRNKDITVRAIDNDQINGTLTNAGLVTEPANGTVTVIPGGVFIYTPNNGFCGEEDSFTYFIENENGADTATVNIMVMCEEVIVFSGFSPNKDGINDKFEIIGIENYPENTICIFNRWGNQVFLKRGYTNTDAWEGDWNEGDLPDGTYFYVIDLGDGSDKKSGYVQILR